MVPEDYALSVYLLISAAICFLAILCYHLCTSYGLVNGHQNIGERSQPLQLIRKNIRLSIVENHLTLPPSVVGCELNQPTTVVESECKPTQFTQSTQTVVLSAHPVSLSLKTKSLKAPEESRFVLKPKSVNRIESAHMEDISLIGQDVKAINFRAESNF